LKHCAHVMLKRRTMEVRPYKSHGRRATARFILQLAFAFMLVLGVSTAHAQDTHAVGVSAKDVQAKLAYCEVCHGVSAQGFRGYYPIPRLAGQQPQYLENQLQAFVEHRRTNTIMFNVGHVLSPAMITALATDFHELSPKPLGGAPKDLIPAGKKIFDEGILSSNVPACSSCHGPDAKGNGPFPRLAGQLNDYVISKLLNWTKERGQNPTSPDTSAIMAPIAHRLTKPQIEAVAAYLSYLE
jgi:cytochrome c553